MAAWLLKAKYSITVYVRGHTRCSALTGSSLGYGGCLASLSPPERALGLHVSRLHDMASQTKANDEGMSDGVTLGVDGKLPWTAGWHGPQTSADACGDGSGLSEAEHGIATEIERLLIERGPLELNALLQLSPVTKARVAERT